MSVADERTLTIRAAAHEGARRELQQALVAWAAGAKADGAVREAHVCEDVLAPGVFGVEAAMDDAADLDAHLRSPGFGALLGALTVLAVHMDCSIRQPVAGFGRDALTVIRRLRSHSPETGGGDSASTRRER